jgi:hypothetical protein
VSAVLDDFRVTWRRSCPPDFSQKPAPRLIFGGLFYLCPIMLHSTIISIGIIIRQCPHT